MMVGRARLPVSAGPVVLAVACAALLLAQHVAGRACRDALFLSSYGVAALPKAMLAAAAVGLPCVLGAARLMTRFGPGRAIPGLLLASGLLHLVEWLLLVRFEQAAIVLVYLHVSVAGGVAVSGFWSVVNERFDPHTVRIIATKLGAGLALGGLLGGVLSRSVGTTYGLRPILLLIAISSVLGGIGVSRLSSGSSAFEVATPKATAVPSGTSTRYLVTMATLVALMGLSSAVVDFVFKTSVSSELRSEEALVAFFSVFYMALSVVSVAVQLFVTRPLLGRFGLGMGLASLPATTVGLGGGGMLVPGAWGVVLLRGSGAVLESSLFRAAYEPLYAPLPVAQKREKKTLIDVACDRLGEALGSGCVLAMAALAPTVAPRFGLGLAVAASAVAMLLTARLERGYIAELAASLKSGRVKLEDTDGADATTRLTLSKTMVELDREALLRQIAEHRRLNDPKPPEQPKAQRELLTALAAGDAGRINAVLLAGPLEIDLVSLVIPCLERDETAEAAVSALRSVVAKVPGQLVDALLDSERPQKLRRRIPRVLRTSTHPRAVRGLADALSDDEPDLRARSALALREITRKHPELKPPRRVVLAAAARELELAPADALDRIFTLLGLLLDEDTLELSLRALWGDDEKLRGTALEYLEQVIPEPIRTGVWPYLHAGRGPRQAGVRKPAEIAAELRRSIG